MCGSEVVAINPKIFDINWVESSKSRRCRCQVGRAQGDLNVHYGRNGRRRLDRRWTRDRKRQFLGLNCRPVKTHSGDIFQYPNYTLAGTVEDDVVEFSTMIVIERE